MKRLLLVIFAGACLPVTATDQDLATAIAGEDHYRAIGETDRMTLKFMKP